MVKNRDCIHQLPSDRERLTIASIRYSTRMFVRIARPMVFLVVATLFPLSSWVVVFAATVHYSPASRQVIDERLRKYAGDNKQREATLKQMFNDVGCNDQHLSEQSVKGSKLPNIVCLLPGTSAKVILVGAHYDRVSDGDGVVDNWSGASLLPSLYEAVRSQTREHTYIFVGFTDEEKGMVGSRFYVQQMTREQVAATEAMVNMDTLGLAPTEVWASHSDKRLTSALVNIAKGLNLPITGVDVGQVGAPMRSSLPSARFLVSQFTR